MGVDIYMFIEHKNPVTNKWNLVKNSKWSHNMVPINRNSGLFHILCGYNKNDFNEISVIFECKGLPLDIDKETAFWLEVLIRGTFLEGLTLAIHSSHFTSFSYVLLRLNPPGKYL